VRHLPQPSVANAAIFARRAAPEKCSTYKTYSYKLARGLLDKLDQRFPA
jgi:hypothetical protein